MNFTVNLTMIRPEVYDFVTAAGLMDGWAQDSDKVYNKDFTDTAAFEDWNASFASDLNEAFSDRPFYLTYASGGAA